MTIQNIDTIDQGLTAFFVKRGWTFGDGTIMHLLTFQVAKHLEVAAWNWVLEAKLYTQLTMDWVILADGLDPTFRS